jgi:CPA2 family monovalent cation:H+ antiporter-2
MPHDIDLILTITGGLTAALILGLVTQRLRMSPIVGYLLAGVLVGPFTPGVVVKTDIALELAEIGVVLLMFGVGLHFHVKDLLAVKNVALPGAIAQIAFATLLGTLLGRAFGWSTAAGIVFGLAISVASTVVLLRVLSDHSALHTPAGHVAVGWLVIEDLFTVFVLVMLPVLFGKDAGTELKSVLASVGIAIVKIGALILCAWLLGQRGIPKLLAYVSSTRSRELFTLTILVLALGIAVGSMKLFGASMALGAFLAGMIVGQSEFSFRAASEALPMRDAFAVLFFVSVGMLLNPNTLLDNAGLIAATFGVVVLGKSLIAFVVVRLLRHPPKTALSVAVALAQIGEFSFIVGNTGLMLGVLPERANQALVATAILSITLNPMLYRLVEPLSRRLRAGSRASASIPGRGDDDAHRAIVIGYGPIGQTVTQLLTDDGIRTTVIELNHETVNALTRQGISAIHGDAAQLEILEQAGVAHASSLVFTASGTPPEAVVHLAKTLNPKLRILARATYLKETHAARAAGADLVVSAEGEVALAMAEHLLRDLGATPEQIDRAREKVRERLRSTTTA